jgi:hypothetical protein
MVAKQITVHNADRKGFEFRIDGFTVPAIEHCIQQGSIRVTPGHGHSLVELTLITEHVSIEHDLQRGTAP